MEYRLATRFRVDARGQRLPPPAMAEAARLYAATELEAAASCCEAIVADEPTHAEAHHLLGVLRFDLGRHEAAAASLRTAVSLDPRNGRAHYNLGNALQALERHAEAESCFRSALAFIPDSADALNNLGNSLRALERDREAIACYRSALDRRPDNAPALYNMALSLRRLNRLDEAEAALRAALAMPVPPKQAHRLAEVREVLVAVLVELGRDVEALEMTPPCPDYPRAEWNEGLILLRMGRLREGWPKYEGRWTLPGFRDEADAARPPPPVLRLDEIAGKRVLVRGEQGRGDVIQFARYVPMLAGLGARVTLAVVPDLMRLMGTLAGAEEVIDFEAAVPAHDVEAALLSLPFAFGTDMESIPAEIPYLGADPASRARWAARLGPRTLPRVGLCWWGSQHIPERSIPIAALAPLLSVPGIAFHGVGKDRPDADRAWIGAHGVIEEHGAALTDFAETAALLAHMDLVITIDTAVAHLAGALGRPVWVLLRRSADWRWLLHREDSPWYRTARLFRQDGGGEWGPVIASVASALDAFALPDGH